MIGHLYKYDEEIYPEKMRKNMRKKIRKKLG